MKTRRITSATPPGAANPRPASGSTGSAFCTWCEGDDLHAHIHDATGNPLNEAPVMTQFQADLVLTLARLNGRLSATERRVIREELKRLPLGSPHDPRNILHDICETHAGNA